VLPTLVRRCRVPPSLADVTSVRADAEVDPREVGVAPDGPARIWQAVEGLYRSGIHPAIQLCVRRQGRILIDRAIGHAVGNGPDDPPDAPKVPCTPDTPFNIFSASKAVTAMLVHLLDERDALRLDDRVCDYIPEFAAHGKFRITIRHLLSHRAGMPNLAPEVMRLDYLAQPEEIVRILCATQLSSRPGQRLAYHAISGGFVLGELVRRVTGHDIRTLLADAVQRPLGFRWLRYGVEPQDVERVARSYATGPPVLPPLSTIMARALGVGFYEAIELSNDPRFLVALIPAGNLIATAEEMSRFYQLLLDGGTLDGVRVFAPRTLRRATTEHSYLEIDLSIGLPLRYGLGFMLGASWFSLYGPGTEHCFGHIGFTNVVTWADPERQVAAALMTSGKPILYLGLYNVFDVLRQIGLACPKIRTLEGLLADAPPAR
jgi:CubicO group peptidase (beta-lactamase class C family)